MRISSPERTAAYREKGWWRGETVDQTFRRAVAARGDAEALVDPPNREALVGGSPRRLSFAEVDAQVDAIAATFADLGVGRDDVVVTQLPNVVEGLLAFLACARLGAILSPVSVAFRAHELRQILSSVRPKVILTAPRFHGHDHAAMALSLCAEADFGAAVVCIGDEAPHGAHALDAEVRLRAEVRVATPADQDAADVLTVCWTSGTEAQPKGVPRHHDHWGVNGEAMREAAELTSADVVLNPFPLINITAFGGMVMPWLQAQCRLVQHHPLDLAILLRQIETERVSYTVMPPAVLNMLLQNEAMLAGADLSSLRALGSGSAPLAPWMVRGWQERHGVTVMNIFGSNEGASLISSGAAIPDPEQRARFFPRFGAGGLDWGQGFPRTVRTRLVDPETEAEITEPGRVGELRIDGAMVFDGYWRAPELTAAAFDAQGWFRTGDLFEIAPEEGGRFYLYVGRSKDIIIRGGQNISPAELDALIEGHPKVREASCAGYPDERLGEKVCAVVATRPDETLSLDEVCDFLSAKGVAVFKLPEKLRVIDALPRNALGKVLRRELAPVAAS